MTREHVLKVVLGLVGLLFVAAIYPVFAWHAGPADQMLGIVYVTLGIFLLAALRNTSANRSLIAFTAWSSLAHGGLMAVQALRNEIPRADLLRAALPLVIVGVILIVLAPAKSKAPAA